MTVSSSESVPFAISVPISIESTLFCAEAMSFSVVAVAVPQYFSTRIRPSYRIMNVVELLCCTNALTSSSFAWSKPAAAAVTVSHVPVAGGK